jgi:acyl-CoA synthetase (AMP-forming)/AMP-acid ligase II
MAASPSPNPTAWAPGPVVGVVQAASLDFIGTMLALEAEGAVAVLLRAEGDAERIAATGVSRVIVPAAGAGWSHATYAPRGGDGIAQIGFTSGTTGTATAVALTHANLANTQGRLIAAQGLDRDVREYLGVPPGYSFGLGRVRAVAGVGGQLFVPAHGFDPHEFGQMLQTGAVNALSAVPTLLRVLLANRDQLGDAGARLRWLEIGSQAMTRAEKEAVKALFPNARIVQHYGLTQASRTTFLDLHAADGAQLDSVGRAVAPVELRIDGDGELHVRGPHVAASRLVAGALQPLTDADGWLATGDLARLDDGWLVYEGRRDDQINCGGIKLQPDAIEAGITAALGAVPVGVARLNDALRGDGILVAAERGAGVDVGALRAAADKVIAGLGVHAGTALDVTLVDTLPRTETGKLRRAALAAAHVPHSNADTPEARLVKLWQQVLGVEAVGVNDSFFDLGGDPLVGHDLIAAMEAQGISAAAASGLWDGLSIAQILTLDAAPVAGGGAEAQILALWRETLGREDVSLTQGFYDVGGDSLSAITLALNMERAGFDPELARAIFDGKTIAEIAAEADAAAGPQVADRPAPVRTKSQIALLSEGMNLVKGILVLCMIASHWVPIYLGYLGMRGGLISKAIQPALSMGTPTLAFIFGIGIPVFHARQYAGSGPAFRANVRKGGLLLAVGLGVGFVLEAATRLVAGETFDATLVASSFTNGPFLYFLAATLSMPLWIGAVRRDTASMVRLALVALVLMAAYLALLAVLPADAGGAAAVFLRETFAGHWSLFQLGSLTLAGVVVGLLIENHLAVGGSLRSVAPVGVIVFGTGMVMSAAAQDLASWITPHEAITLWSAIAYAGIALWLVGRFEAIAQAAAPVAPARLGVQLLASLGILLFPLYVLQSLVYHSASILEMLTGQSLIKMLTLCIVIFLVLASYPVWRVWRLYYADRR